MRQCARAAFLGTMLFSTLARAEPQWIWNDAGDPLTSAPMGPVWFRRVVRAPEPSTGEIRIACDEAFQFWFNGQKIADGAAGKVHRFNLNGRTIEGANVFAIRAENTGGSAGLLVDGLIRGQNGKLYPILGNPEWKSDRGTQRKDSWLSSNFDDSGWKAVRVLAPHHQSPWKSIQLDTGKDSRFSTPDGFEVKQVAGATLTGSVVAMTWGNRGRLLVSRERGPILALTDQNHDGVYDHAEEVSSQLSNCQGLCMVGDELYCVGDGPKGAGVYRLPGRNRDGKADAVHVVTTHRGPMGEHGPHAVVFGPDGWLYHNSGNHAWIQNQPESTSPVRGYYEGDLLTPKFEDANGHASGIKAPGGTVWRFNPDGSKWWLHTVGFRNQYDIAFNNQGELFTFDSDMEWDVGVPWYRPVRVNHCTPGAEFGWRSGASNWPAYYFDSLPGSADIGRGSPTGIIFYECSTFPAPYRGALLLCDWSMGRILAMRLRPNGASPAGDVMTLVTGNPLNVSDIEVDRDGSVLFSTGGRNTEGGIYRLTYPAGAKPALSADTLETVLDLPQPSSAWSREIAASFKEKVGVDRWRQEITEVLRSGAGARKIRALSLLAQLGPPATTEQLAAVAKDADPSVRAFSLFLLAHHSDDNSANAMNQALSDPDAVVRRRALEGLVQGGHPIPTGKIVDLLDTEDRFLRFASRNALERAPAETWRSSVLSSDSIRVQLEGLLALHRLGDAAFAPDDALALEAKLLARSDLSVELQSSLLRMIALTLSVGGKGPAGDAIATLLLRRFPVTQAIQPAERSMLNTELARVLARLQPAGALEKIVAKMEKEADHSMAIHYALVASYIRANRTFETERKILAWYEQTKNWEGGHSFPGFLQNILVAGLQHASPATRRQLIESWRDLPFSTRLMLRRLSPGQIEDHPKLMQSLILALESKPAESDLLALAIESLGRNPADSAQRSLQTLFEDRPDLREVIALALAQSPSLGSHSYYIRSMSIANPTTLKLLLRALLNIDSRPKSAEEIRQVILAGQKLGADGGLAAANLLERWTQTKHGAGADPQKAIAHFQKWFREKYPNEPAPELPPTTSKLKFSFSQIMNYLDSAPGREGSVEKGKAIFTKANCAKCHKFGAEGQGIGPDLTSVRRRFQRKEILESLYYPSQVVSDQYRSVSVSTVDGLIHTGMPIPQPGSDKLALLLSTGQRLELAKKEIDEQKPSKLSIMPEELLKDLSLGDIGDLFAYLETSRLNESPAASPPPATASESPAPAPPGKKVVEVKIAERAGVNAPTLRIGSTISLQVRAPSTNKSAGPESITFANLLLTRIQYESAGVDSRRQFVTLTVQASVADAARLESLVSQGGVVSLAGARPAAGARKAGKKA